MVVGDPKTPGRMPPPGPSCRASTVAAWTYTELREVTLAPAPEVVLFVLVSPFARRIRWGSILSRSAYGAFMVQTIFLLGFALTLRPLGLPAEIKAMLVALGAVGCSFAASWLLISRLPGSVTDPLSRRGQSPKVAQRQRPARAPRPPGRAIDVDHHPLCLPTGLRQLAAAP